MFALQTLRTMDISSLRPRFQDCPPHHSSRTSNIDHLSKVVNPGSRLVTRVPYSLTYLGLIIELRLSGVLVLLNNNTNLGFSITYRDSPNLNPTRHCQHSFMKQATVKTLLFTTPFNKASFFLIFLKRIPSPLNNAYYYSNGRWPQRKGSRFRSARWRKRPWRKDLCKERPRFRREASSVSLHSSTFR
jgi:hypothetical protein